MNEITLQLIEDGKVVQEQKTHNFVTPQWKRALERVYRSLFLNPTENIIDGSGSRNMSFMLWENTTTFDNFDKPVNNLNMLGHCDAFSRTVADTTQGIYLDTVFEGGIGKFSYTWEFPTTSANGTISSIGFQAYNGNSMLSAYALPYAISLSSLHNESGVPKKYIGYKDISGEKYLYFRVYNTTGNPSHISVIKESDWTVNSQFDIDLSGGLIDPYSDESISYNQNTVYCNGKIWQLRSINNTNITFKNSDEVTLTLGDDVVSSDFSEQLGQSVVVSGMTAGETIIYLYSTVITDNSRSLIREAMITYDTESGAVSCNYLSEEKHWNGNGQDSRNFGYGYRFNLCKNPFSDRLFVSIDTTLNYIDLSDLTSKILLTKYGLANSDYVYTVGNDIYARSINNGVSVVFNPESHSSGNPSTNCIYKLYSYNTGDTPVISYAELDTPIVKTDSQTLRVKYTIQHF